jgi:hypothetical protein
MSGGDEYEYGSGDAPDGGLPPGGVPEQQPCTAQACPACEMRQMSAGCIYALGHSGSHVCASSHSWDDYDASEPRCFELCPTDSAWCIRPKGHDGVHWCGQHDY